MLGLVDDIEVFIIGAILACSSAFIMQRTNRVFDLRHLTIPAVWYFTYFVLIFLPSFFVFIDKPSPYRYTYMAAVCSALLTVPFGVLLTTALSSFRTKEIKAFYDLPIERPMLPNRNKLLFVAALILGIGLICSWYYEQSTPIPLFYMLANPGSAGELAWLRDYSFKLLDSPIRYLYHLNRDFLFPLLILIALGSYLIHRSRAWLILFLFCTLTGVVYASANIAKSPTATIILLMMINLYIYYNKRINFRHILAGFVLFLSFPTFVLVVSENSGFTLDAIFEAVTRMLWRIFYAPTWVLYYFFEVVPAHVPFLYGRGMGSITKLVGVDYFDLGHYVGVYVLGAGGSGYSSATAAFVAELYTDFGFPGAIIGGFILGVVMQCMNISVLRGNKSIMSVVTYTLLIYFFATLTYLQIVGALILSGLPILWLLYKSNCFR